MTETMRCARPSRAATLFHERNEVIEMTPHTKHAMTVRLALLTLAMSLLLGAPAAAQGIHVGIVPDGMTVAPGAAFDLEIQVLQAGSQFNGFDATIDYDPAALTFQQASPVGLQQGCLMTGACSAACGNTFHRFTAAADSQSITDILLCNQVLLTGPGQIYKLHFIASNTPQVTHVTFRSATFYNAGLYVNPVVTFDAAIGIGVTLDVGDREGVHGLQLSAQPNPAHGSVVFAVGADTPGLQTLEVHDVAGRLVLRLESGWRTSGTRRLTWNGTDAGGSRVAPGVYLVTLHAGNAVRKVRVALLP